MSTTATRTLSLEAHPPERTRNASASARACGGALLLCGLAGLAATSVPGRVSSYSGELERWRFPVTMTVWAIILIMLGTALLGVPRRVPIAATTTGGLLAALIAGESFVGIRDWFNVAGSAGVNLPSLADVVTLAAGSSIGGTIATATVAVAVWPDAIASRSRQPMWVLAGLIATATPIVLIAAQGGPFTATAIGAVFISPSLPCAAAVALAGICRRDIRLVLLATAALVLTSAAATSLI